MLQETARKDIGIRGKTYKLLQSYLTGCSQLVNVNDVSPTFDLCNTTGYSYKAVSFHRLHGQFLNIQCNGKSMQWET